MFSRKREVHVHPVYYNCTVIILNEGPVILEEPLKDTDESTSEEEDDNGIKAEE